VPAPTRSVATIRRDLAAALAAAVAERGYAATTIADIVAHAHVSKRTFYQHFADKEECMMALYDHVCDRLMLKIRGSGVPTDRRAHDAAAAYLGALDAMPDVTRALLIEVQAAGRRAFQLRQETLRKFARTLIVMVESGRAADPQMPALALPQALAMVGGINELLLHAVDPYTGPVGSNGDNSGPFMALHGDVVRLVSAVLTYQGAAGSH
jgi:AcrR family transcriptional regulator